MEHSVMSLSSFAIVDSVSIAESVYVLNWYKQFKKYVITVFQYGLTYHVCYIYFYRSSLFKEVAKLVYIREWSLHHVVAGRIMQYYE